MGRFARFLKGHLSRLAAAGAVLVVLTLFALYYFGYYDLTFVERPASWNHTVDELGELLFGKGDAPATEPPATEPPATEPPATEPPVTEPVPSDGAVTDSPIPPAKQEPTESEFRSVEELAAAGFLPSNQTFRAGAMTFGLLTPAMPLPEKRTFREGVTYMLSYQAPDPTRSLSNLTPRYLGSLGARPAVSLYMGYFLIDDGTTLTVADSDGHPLCTMDSERLFCANVRDADGRPLFFEKSSVTVTVPAVTETRTGLDANGNPVTQQVVIQPAKDVKVDINRYYYLSVQDGVGTFVESDYREEVDGRGAAVDTPAGYGTPDNGFGRRVRVTRTYLTTLKGANVVLNKCAWCYLNAASKTLTGYEFSRAYAYREGRAVAEYTYSFDATRGDKFYTYEITSLVVLNERGKILFRPYSVFRYETWYMISWLTFPDQLGEQALGFFYYDHGLLRVRRVTVDYSYWVYQSGEARILEDENILIDLNGNEVATPAGCELVSYSDGIMLLKTKERTYAYVDYRGVVIADPLFDRAHAFSEGLGVCREKQSGKWGVIDTKGNTVIPFVYDEMSQVSEGTIAAFKDGCWTIFRKMAKAG